MFAYKESSKLWRWPRKIKAIAATIDRVTLQVGNRNSQRSSYKLVWSSQCAAQVRNALLCSIRSTAQRLWFELSCQQIKAKQTKYKFNILTFVRGFVVRQARRNTNNANRFRSMGHLRARTARFVVQTIVCPPVTRKIAVFLSQCFERCWSERDHSNPITPDSSL